MQNTKYFRCVKPFENIVEFTTQNYLFGGKRKKKKKLKFVEQII
jgi:hypothetical protein